MLSDLMYVVNNDSGKQVFLQYHILVQFLTASNPMDYPHNSFYSTDVDQPKNEIQVVPKLLPMN